MEIEISEEAWPDVVSRVKAISIVLDQPPPTSELALGPPHGTTTRAPSSPSNASLDPSTSTAFHQGSPELSSPAREDESPKEGQVSMTSEFRQG